MDAATGATGAGATSRTPSVAVIVVGWNRAADLRRALSAIFANAWPALEVIVVDNASTDDAAAVAASFSAVRLIRNPENVGFAAANEIGLRETKADYVALINNDALVAPDWIARLVAFLEAHPDAAAAGAKQFFWDDENPAFDRTNRYYAYTLVEPETGAPHAQLSSPLSTPGAVADDVREVATLSGAAVMVRRGAIDAVGAPFLDPIFFCYYEETDFFARAVRKGFRLYYTGEPACWHRVRASTAAEPYRYLYWMYRNAVIFAFRNFDDAKLARRLRDARKSARAHARGDSDDARAHRDAYAWIVDHRALLDDHRARFFDGKCFVEEAKAIQSRASYYGHARPEVCALVPESARRVVDFGCAGGALGRALKAVRPGIEVRGVEPVASQAERARAVLDDVTIGRAEDALPESWPQPDCVIFADVLEHLVDPWSAVRRARALLAPGGTLVVSLPNVLHHSVVTELMAGRFDYKDAGVLDRTHLRFFTAATARELIEQAGFQVERMERVVEPPPRLSGLRTLAAATPANGKRGLRNLLADVCTVQYLIVAANR